MTADERRRLAVDLYVKQGKKLHDVAAALGCSHTTVWRDLKAAGVDCRAAPPPVKQRAPGADERQRRAVELYATGLGTEAVADAVGCSAYTVARDLRLAGVELRPPGEHGRKHPPPLERTCERDGCASRFTPTGTQVARGDGRFCSTFCSNSVRGEAVKAERRDEAHGHGHWASCELCGEKRWVWKSAEGRRRGQRFFCSRECWGLYRLHVLGLLPRAFVERFRNEELRTRILQKIDGRKGGGRKGDAAARRTLAKALVVVEKQSTITRRGLIEVLMVHIEGRDSVYDGAVKRTSRDKVYRAARARVERQLLHAVADDAPEAVARLFA